MNESKNKDTEPHVAHVKDIKISSLLNRSFRYKRKEDAVKKLNWVLSKVIPSRTNLPYEDAEHCLWIKGFALNNELKKKGYLGNYCQIKIEKLESGEYTFYGEKYDVEINSHPQKAWPKRKHPNPGHPILKEIKKNKPFDHKAEAWALLHRLHREFPDTTVPVLNDSLAIQLYSRSFGGKDNKGNFVKKFSLDIKKLEGKYFIQMYERIHQGKTEKIRYEDISYRNRILHGSVLSI